MIQIIEDVRPAAKSRLEFVWLEITGVGRQFLSPRGVGYFGRPTWNSPERSVGLRHV